MEGEGNKSGECKNQIFRGAYINAESRPSSPEVQIYGTSNFITHPTVQCTVYVTVVRKNKQVTFYIYIF